MASFDGSREPAQARVNVIKNSETGAKNGGPGLKQYLGFSFRASAKALESSFLLEAVAEVRTLSKKKK